MTTYQRVMYKVLDVWAKTHSEPSHNYLARILKVAFREAYASGYADAITGKNQKETNGIRAGFNSMKRGA